jgi:cytosine/uracil/thiamine/allantoin permease
MKTATAIRIPNYAARRRRCTVKALFPNAASARYHLGKLLDAALAAATTIGVVVSLMFAFTLWG